MSPRRTALLLATTATLASLGASALAIGSSAAPGRAAQAAAAITPMRVDGVRLGTRHSVLRERGLVGPDTRSARLRPPLRGSVDYTSSGPRRVRSISVTKGARARGVGIGSTIRAIRARFPNVTLERGTEEIFRLTLVQTPERPSGGRITFGVSTETKRTTIIGVPYIAFCE